MVFHQYLGMSYVPRQGWLLFFKYHSDKVRISSITSVLYKRKHSQAVTWPKVTWSLPAPAATLPDFNPANFHWEACCSISFLSLLYMSLGSQSSLDEAIQNLATVKQFQVKQTQCIFYMTPNTARRLLPSLLEANNLPLKVGRPKAM